MKYVLLVGDGMSDYPLEELGGKTPLQVAQKPNMDSLARNGRCGLAQTLVEKLPADSGVANMSLLGYDPEKYYPGRGPLEAANLGVVLSENDLAFRCNLVTEKDGILLDYSAGHITSEEAKELIELVDRELGSEKINFYPGIAYRNLLVLRDSNLEVKCKPPHDVCGSKISEIMPEPKCILNELIEASKKILESHPVNEKREAEGKNKANLIWPWGQGRKPSFPTLKERFGISGSVISAVAIINGLGLCAGLKVVKVPGATGYFDTNYKNKGEYALKALEERDFVYIHVEAPDEAGHIGNVEEKIRAIENIDKHILGKLLDSLDEYRICVTPDHATPIKVKTHTRDPVPFVISGEGIEKDSRDSYGEFKSAQVIRGYEMFPLLMG